MSATRSTSDYYVTHPRDLQVDVTGCTDRWRETGHLAQISKFTHPMINWSQTLRVRGLTMSLEQLGVLYFLKFHPYGHELRLFACCGPPLSADPHVQRYRGDRVVEANCHQKWSYE